MTLMTFKEENQVDPRGKTAGADALTVLGICLDGDTRSLLQKFVERAQPIRFKNHLTSYPGDADAGRGTTLEAADVILIDLDQDRRQATATAESLHSQHPEAAIFAISSQSQPDAIIQAMRSGCREYLVKPIKREQLLEALARVQGRRKDKKESSTAKIITFIGAKGGCGVTTIVTHLGALLAGSYRRKTLVIDLHHDVGDAALYLKLTNYRYHAYDLAENTDRLDSDLLQSFVLHHSSGLDVIPGPEGVEAARHVASGAISQLLEFLRPRYEFILLDVAPGLSNGNMEVARVSDQLNLVTVAEVSAVRNVVRYVDQLKADYKEKIRVILNRHQKRSPITDEQIEKVVKQDIFWKVPNQYAHVLKAIHGGDPLAQNSSSEVAQSLSEWAGMLGRNAVPAEKKNGSSGILGLWSR
jgi:pilus assembly protein CpaE